MLKTETFLAERGSHEFQALRKSFRGFAFPTTIAFLAWYFFYIVTATFAQDFVEIPVYGVINLGMILGLAQFATAGLVTWAYVRFADTKIDPATEVIRNRMEGST
ncbi:DUF485 domain-containing protein [Corynebacterium sp. SCR221107]|uniref:DUF485 domain-containing protein n=1 Tax=Corynebacterium sp. SCR221107 TaxID=3017361 RepID=UPI0022EC8144|nr:DUF485 domain-containing protein [Corynebacterium sp. SCR221107]WBT09629.1 DUF485 domain-containing protein [Corynebacterium sp. SCR221107]